MTHYINLVFHHGGKFTNDVNLTYIGGEEDVWDIDVDLLSIPVIDEMFRDHGYQNYLECLWLILGVNLREGLQQLKGDADVIALIGEALKTTEIKFFFVHPVIENPELVNESFLIDGTGVEEDEQDDGNEHTEYLQEIYCKKNFQDSNDEGDESAEENEGDSEDEEENEAEDEAEHEAEDEAEEYYSGDPGGYSYDVNYADESAEDNPYMTPPEMQVDDDDNEFFMKDVEVGLEEDDQTQHMPTPSATTNQNMKKKYKRKKRKAANKPFEVYEDPFGAEEYHSEELHTASDDSDDKEKQQQINPKFNEEAAFGDVHFELGMEFSSLAVFKNAVKDYTVHLGREVYWTKNDKSRARAVCKEDCPWEILCSYSNHTRSYQIKTFSPNHTCARQTTNKQANRTWISEKLVPFLRTQSALTVKDAWKILKENYEVEVCEMKLYRALKVARDFVEGSEKAQYAKFWDYAQELRRCNPNSSVLLGVDRPSPQSAPVFKRFYVCLDACKRGFISSCRPLIGLDGCFLKGYYRGILLAAVAQDGNESFYSIAYAIVDLETKETWSWFLTLLIEDLGHPRERGYNFISDQQKGLVPAMKQLMPGVPHRFCMRHVWANMARRWKDANLRKVVWTAAKSPTTQEWEKNMVKIHAINKHAASWLRLKEAGAWTRSAFNCHIKSQNLLNNMCEQFNSEIVKYRGQPILTMAEGIRGYIMRKRTGMIEKIQKYKGVICPKAQSKLNNERRESRFWTPTWVGDSDYNKFEVEYRPMKKAVVDLHTRSCSCREWDLNGIPCKHACSALARKGKPAENYVHEWYSTTTWKQAYEPFLGAVPGEEYWAQTGIEAVQPPPLKRGPGRPKIQRKKTNDPPEAPSTAKLKRKYGDIKCGKCGHLDHNTRTCKGGPVKTKRIKKTTKEQPVQSSQPESQSQAPPVSSQETSQLGHRPKLSIRRNVQPDLQAQRVHTQPQQEGISTQTTRQPSVTRETLLAATEVNRKMFTFMFSSGGQPGSSGSKQN